MSCTPEISGITSKISPICSSINKSLLTPCRRVGLSRKRKTPSSIVHIISQESPYNNHNISAVCTETTPVNYGKSVKKKSSRTSLSNNTKSSTEVGLEESIKLNIKFAENKHLEKTVPKKGLFQTYSEDLFNTSDSSITNSENIEPPPENTETNNSEDQISYTAVLRDDFVKLETNVSSSDFLGSNKPAVDTLHKLSKSIIQDDNADDDFRIIKKSKNQIKRTLSLKKSTSSTDRDIESTSKNLSNSTKECTVQLEKINENVINLHEKKTVQKSSSATIEVMVDEEEDAFTSTPEQEKVKKNNMLQKIRTLEKTLKQKKNRLADLRQASIYKNKHSIEDLNQLTSKWATGCVSGLNDLLTQLQAHGPIDMTTLLNNLRIPSDMVTKLFPPNVE